MNKGLTSDQIKIFCDFLKQANDTQIKFMRSAMEGEDKLRQMIRGEERGRND